MDSASNLSLIAQPSSGSLSSLVDVSEEDEEAKEPQEVDQKFLFKKAKNGKFIKTNIKVAASPRGSGSLRLKLTPEKKSQKSQIEYKPMKVNSDDFMSDESTLANFNISIEDIEEEKDEFKSDLDCSLNDQTHNKVSVA